MQNTCNNFFHVIFIFPTSTAQMKKQLRFMEVKWLPKWHNQLKTDQHLNLGLLRFFFFMWTIFKVFIEFITILLLFLFFFPAQKLLLLFYVLIFLPWGMWDLSFLTRGQTHIPYSGRWSLNHWATREVPRIFYSRTSVFSIPLYSL